MRIWIMSSDFRDTKSASINIGIVVYVLWFFALSLILNFFTRFVKVFNGPILF